jgi:hypothetical protein
LKALVFVPIVHLVDFQKDMDQSILVIAQIVLQVSIAGILIQFANVIIVESIIIHYHGRLRALNAPEENIRPSLIPVFALIA